jgi:hypothetical protein
MPRRVNNNDACQEITPLVYRTGAKQSVMPNTIHMKRFLLLTGRLLAFALPARTVELYYFDFNTNDGDDATSTLNCRRSEPASLRPASPNLI